MVDYTGVLLLLVTLMFTYLTLHKDHPVLAGIIYVLTGGMTFIVMPSSNAYGLIIIATGFIRIFTAPMGGPSANA